MCFGFYYLCRKFTNVKIMWGALELYLSLCYNYCKYLLKLANNKIHL